MATNYDNYDDERLTQVETNKQAALSEHEQTYKTDMIDKSDKYFQDQIDAVKNWADEQTKFQKESGQLVVDQIEQQKEQAQKDYTKEQSGAYADWQKQSSQYGVEAEKIASAGLAGTGYSESSQVSMYNTYQNRVATAREVYNKAVLNYDNAINDAKLQNNAALAEIAYQALQTQLELSLEGFQYKNNLISEYVNKKLEIENLYHSYYLDVLDQINTEKALAEEIRQFDSKIAFDREQAEIERAFKETEAAREREFEAAQAKLDREHDHALLEAKNKQEKEMAQKEDEYKVELLNKEFENEKAAIEAEKQAQLAILDEKNPGSGSSGTGSSGIYTISDAYNQGKYGLTVANSPLSVEGAAKAVAEGKVTAEVKDGKIYLTPNPSYLAGQSTLDKYTLLNGLGRVGTGGTSKASTQPNYLTGTYTALGNNRLTK